MFQMGESYGALDMVLVCNRITRVHVLPKVWQSAIGVPDRPPGGTQSKWKSILKKYAQSLFPDEKITLRTSDAFLLAYYCRALYGF